MITLHITQYNLTAWIIYLRQFPTTQILSSQILRATYRSINGNVSITDYLEVITISGPAATMIALKHPEWIK